MVVDGSCMLEKYAQLAALSVVAVFVPVFVQPSTWPRQEESATPGKQATAMMTAAAFCERLGLFVVRGRNFVLMDQTACWILIAVEIVVEVVAAVGKVTGLEDPTHDPHPLPIFEARHLTRFSNSWVSVVLPLAPPVRPAWQPWHPCGIG